MIAKEYGWTDDQILDLTLPRWRQVRDVIMERRAEDVRADLIVKEAMVQTVAQFIAAGPGKKNVRAARQIRLFKRPRKVVVPSYERVKRMFRGS